MVVERPALERRVLASLEAGRIPVLLGGCGTGRTSLLLRLESLLGTAESQYLDMAAAATTPERCLFAVRQAARLAPLPPETMPDTTRAAADALFAYFDHAQGASGPATFLLDEFLDLRTFENFPGLRHIQREIVNRWAASPSRFVLASRFTYRVHRLLRDAPARFEVIHMPPLDASEVLSMAERLGGVRRTRAADIASAVAALSGGHPAAAQILLNGLASLGTASDPVAALASAMAPDGALTARSRECYEFRLHRARGYGALKAILGVLAEQEPVNLTDIARTLHRTPGSTKDYLSWLEDVDLVTMRGKRYVITDPLVRLYVRLYGRPVPPTDDEIVREVSGFARTRLNTGSSAAATNASSSGGGSNAASVSAGTPATTMAALRPPAPARPAEPAADLTRSGIIEID